MATDVQCRLRIGKLASHAAVLKLLSRPAESGGFWTPGTAFEYGILRAFELEIGSTNVVYPFPVVAPNGSADRKPGTIEQVDGVVYLPSLAALIESKDFEAHVDIEPIAKLRMRLECRPAGTLGIIFTRHGLTEPASYLLRHTHPKNILVWQGQEIDVAIRKKKLRAGLMAKYRHAVEYGLPDYNLQRESWA